MRLRENCHCILVNGINMSPKLALKSNLKIGAGFDVVYIAGTLHTCILWLYICTYVDNIYNYTLHVLIHTHIYIYTFIHKHTHTHLHMHTNRRLCNFWVCHADYRRLWMYVNKPVGQLPEASWSPNTNRARYMSFTAGGTLPVICFLVTKSIAISDIVSPLTHSHVSGIDSSEWRF